MKCLYYIIGIVVLLAISTKASEEEMEVYDGIREEYDGYDYAAAEGPTIQYLSDEDMEVLTPAVEADSAKQQICIPEPKPGKSSDCKTLKQSGGKSGVYTVNPDGGQPFQVYCDMETNGGGWTVIQRRLSNAVDFFRGWADYKKGFGDLRGNFWLGLDKIARLTKSSTSLRIEMGRFNGQKFFAQYTQFAVSGPNYKLSIGGFTGNAGDSMAYHNGQCFVTKDHGVYKKCALLYKGAWWYKAYNWCYYSHLNGVYYNDNNHRGYTGLSWAGINGWESLKSARMMLRRNA